MLTLFTMNAQELPYREIPDAPEDYASGNIVARLVDGLGFRYYWATEGLTATDLEYRPSPEGRSVLETLQHIYGMSETLLNVPQEKPNMRPQDFSSYSFDELRRMTLSNLNKASKQYANKQAGDFESFDIVFQRGGKQSRFPFWNLLNGMLSDCLYHVGQITLMRRSSGNPINPNVNVFMGTINE